ncbi:MAG: nitrous oxide reductase accessory protein NosL [Candidatus Promineifilaceae bacterium]|nr:nitrous oxide reductase accessory protein NosL [Candidatus Promineifilaceae bacterium]
MRRFLLPIVLLTLLVTGCAAGASIDEPPEILYGEDECERCRMIISDARYAAAYMTEDGQTRRFDDIGGMLLHHLENEEDVHLFWVHDFESEVWVKADEANYVVSEALETPMGFGIAAVNSREEAEEMAAERDGEVFTFSQLMDEAARGRLTPAHAHGQGHDGAGKDHDH